MLEGRKPLAVFHDAYPAEWLTETLARFDPFVRSRRLAHRIIDTPFTEAERARFPDFQGWRLAFFSLPGEEWRIDAFLLISKVSAKTGWNEASNGWRARFSAMRIGKTTGGLSAERDGGRRALVGK